MLLPGVTVIWPTPYGDGLQPSHGAVVPGRALTTPVGGPFARRRRARVGVIRPPKTTKGTRWAPFVGIG